MGHLSTSENVSTKSERVAMTPDGGIVKPINGCHNIKMNGNGKISDNGNCNGNGHVVKRANNTTDHASTTNNSNHNNVQASTKSKAKPMWVEPDYHIDLEEYTRNFKGDKVLGIQFNAPLKWDKVIQIFLLHIVAVVCFVLYPLDKLSLKTVLWSFFTGGVAGFGVTAGAHRYWTHRSFKASLPLRIILMICFSLAGQNTLYDWVRDHRVHHKFSETDGDPHNANRGFFFAHVGWLMMLKHPEVLRRGRQLDLSDIAADPVVQFHQKYFIPLKMLLCFIIPTLIPIYFWGELWYLSFMQQCLFRYVSSLNFTWSVNSAAHLWGTRPYDKRIQPSENIYVSIIAMGEGWHNYHHVFPWDYKAAELGNYSVNLTTGLLDLFGKIGWAWDRKQPSRDLVIRTLEKYGDGTHELAKAGKVHQANGNGHCHYPEVPDPEFEEEDAESSSTESSKLDENDNLKSKVLA